MDKLLDDITDELVSSISEDDAITLYDKLRSKFHWSGAFFSIYDIESAWRYCMEYEHGLENFSDPMPLDVLNKVLYSFKWQDLDETLSEYGNEIISNIVASIVKGEELCPW